MNARFFLVAAALCACEPDPAPPPMVTASQLDRIEGLRVWRDQERNVTCYYVEKWSAYGGGPALSCVVGGPRGNDR